MSGYVSHTYMVCIACFFCQRCYQKNEHEEYWERPAIYTWLLIQTALWNEGCWVMSPPGPTRGILDPATLGLRLLALALTGWSPCHHSREEPKTWCWSTNEYQLASAEIAYWRECPFDILKGHLSSRGSQLLFVECAIGLSGGDIETNLVCMSTVGLNRVSFLVA